LTTMSSAELGARAADASRPGRIALPRRLAILSPVVPPHDSGQAILLHRMFRDVRPDHYRLLTFEDPSEVLRLRRISLPSLPVRPEYLPPGRPLRRYSRNGLTWARQIANPVLRMVRGARDVARVVKRERCHAILACSGGTGLYDLTAGLLASRIAGVPFYAYLLDWWRYQLEIGLTGLGLERYRCIAPHLERLVLRAADGVIVPNEVQADDYRRLYGVRSTVIHNSCDDEVFAVPDEASWPAQTGELRIVYTGQIYDAHFGALRNLTEAARLLEREGVTFHIYSAQTEAEVARGGVGSPAIFHHHLPPPDVYSVQRRADIVVLPLALDSPYPELIRTASPLKLGELLACGRPLLVHAPRGSFVTWYADRYQCGVAVDQDDPAQLVDAIRRIRDDAGLRHRVKKNAQARARLDFTIAAARAQLIQLLAAGAPVSARSDS
jgi:glycosyltransferase involved in cell wall biosynthesis